MTDKTRENLHAAMDAWVSVVGEKAVIEAVVACLDGVVALSAGQPRNSPKGTMASINANLLRRTWSQMV